MTHPPAAEPAPYRFSASFLLTAVALVLVAALPVVDGLVLMVRAWNTTEEYSYGYLIPLVSAFLAWQRRERLRQLEFQGAPSGMILVVLGLVLALLGSFSTIYTLQQYAFVLELAGLVVVVAGWRVCRELAMPLLVLLFMIPLPNFVLNNLSARLQLISSSLGVLVIRAFGITVFNEGNIIDLGTMQLQVAEACSGLRYLFPLMTLGFLMALFFRAPLWQRATVFLASIPVTILMNSLRIGLIGVTVEHWGRAAAEGLLHDFEGWVVFMASAAVLLLLIVALNAMRPGRVGWRDTFAVEVPPPPPRAQQWRERSLGRAAWAAATLVLVVGVVSLALPRRVEATPARNELLGFPMQLNGWTGRRDHLGPEYISQLGFDDYMIADYRQGSSEANLYVAWYDSQRSGRATHSPRTCIPGGGWHIQSLTQATLPGVQAYGAPLRVNRVLITNGAQRDIVYYWFPQRGRVLTNEYAVKWYLFWDALTRNRTDGALVRVVMTLADGEDERAVDEKLVQFISTFVPRLGTYVPG